MKKTILTCDRCKLDVDALNEVGAGLRSIKYGMYGSGYHSWDLGGQIHADWCRPCCVEVGFITENYGKKEEKPIIPPPTLEDMIREMIREEIDSK